MFTPFVLSYIICFAVLWPWFLYVTVLVIHMNSLYDIHNNVIGSFPWNTCNIFFLSRWIRFTYPSLYFHCNIRCSYAIFFIYADAIFFYMMLIIYAENKW